jgi:hypothetical protein
MSTPQPDFSTIERYFHTLWPTLPDGAFIVPFIIPGQIAYYCPTVARAIEIAQREATNALQGHFNLYVHMATSHAAYPSGVRLNLEQGRMPYSLAGVWFDVDFRDPAHADLHTLAPDVDTIFHIIKQAPLPWTMATHTGHGIHFYWLFDEPWVLHNTEEIHVAGESVHRWQLLLKSLLDKHGYWGDTTSDLPRVLRIPGTVNYGWMNKLGPDGLPARDGGNKLIKVAAPPILSYIIDEATEKSLQSGPIWGNRVARFS